MTKSAHGRIRPHIKARDRESQRERQRERQREPRAVAERGVSTP
jgi:hypothetical protein